jgi:hypothetical protein
MRSRNAVHVQSTVISCCSADVCLPGLGRRWLCLWGIEVRLTAPTAPRASCHSVLAAGAGALAGAYHGPSWGCMQFGACKCRAEVVMVCFLAIALCGMQVLCPSSFGAHMFCCRGFVLDACACQGLLGSTARVDRACQFALLVLCSRLACCIQQPVGY